MASHAALVALAAVMVPKQAAIESSGAGVEIAFLILM